MSSVRVRTCSIGKPKSRHRRMNVSLPTSSYLKEPDINLIAALLRGLLVRELALAA